MSGYPIWATSASLPPLSALRSSPLSQGVLPSDEVKTAEIDITADGRYLIASNRGHNSLAVFAEAADGSRTYQACYPTEPVPRFFGIDPTSRLVLSAGSQTGCVATFSLDGETGNLQPSQKYEVGAGPLWIEFAEKE